jgi:excisionase family DNA binding protein
VLRTPAPAAVVVTDAYFSLKTLSTYAGLSVRTLRSCLATRTDPLPHYRVGGKILVRRSDFDTWVSRFKRDAACIDAVVDGIMQGL